MVITMRKERQTRIVSRAKEAERLSKKKQTYSQNWPAYDAAQTREATLLHEFAYSLCCHSLKEEPPESWQTKDWNKAKNLLYVSYFVSILGSLQGD